MSSDPLRTWKIIHLTDLHLGSDSTYIDDDKSQTSFDVRQKVVNRLEHILRNDDLLPQTDAIVVSGDITTAGKPQGLDEFARDIAPLLLRRVPNAALCIVPGNHDVIWNLDSESADYYKEKFAPFADMVRGIGATTSLLPVRRGPMAADAPTAARVTFEALPPGPIYFDCPKQLLITCVNSSVRCGEVNSARMKLLHDPIAGSVTALRNVAEKNPTLGRELGHIITDLESARAEAKKQSVFDITQALETQIIDLSVRLDRLRKENEAEWPNILKIAVLHHHLLPFPDKVVEHKPFDLMLDSTSLVSVLDSFGFQLVLTGHQHQPYSLVRQAPHGEMLLLGGTTVGGYPALGRANTQGFRYVIVERSSNGFEVKHPDVFLTGAIAADPRSHVDQIVASSKPTELRSSAPSGNAPHGAHESFAKMEEIIDTKDPDLRSEEFLKFARVVWDGRRGEHGATDRLETDALGSAYEWIRGHLNALNDPNRTINRVYAIDTFDPRIWAVPEAYYWLALQARQFVKSNYFPREDSRQKANLRGSRANRDSRRAEWRIQFSPEVLAAVELSLENVKTVGDPNGPWGESLTSFDDLEDGQLPYVSTPGSPRFEVARILIWEPEWLRFTFVRHLIASHGAFNIPLFFVDRRWAEANDINLAVEYLLLAKSDDRPVSPRRQLRGSVWYPAGSEPPWRNIDACPYQPLEHFQRLLSCPCLVFAADASKMVHENSWDSYRQKIGCLDRSLS